jgi:LysM repeat protein/ABC-type branched-subunit amino acid transport system substrate-binding protein
MKLFLVISLFFLCETLFSQKYASVVFTNGKKYYQHTVLEGNTLFGLQQMYECPVEEILNTNPGVERGLSEGQLLQIPVITKTLMHTVKKGETLFSLARMYYVAVDSIVAKNPGTEAGIKIGQRLKIMNATPRIQIDLPSVSKDEAIRNIPAPSDSVREKFIVSFHDSIISHVVLANETMYSISKRFMVPLEDILSLNNLKSARISSGQVIRIKLKKENVNAVPIRDVPSPAELKRDSIPIFKPKESYNVALFLPFNLDSTEIFNKGITTAAWEYYMGARMAIDSLEKLGLKANFFIYDYQSRKETIDQQLAKPEIKKMDLIFAPFQLKDAEKVANWSKSNNVRIIFPVSVPSSFLNENKYAYALTPTNEFMAENLANYIYQIHDNQQIVIIKGEKSDDLSNYDAFLSAFRQLPNKVSRPRIIEATWNDYKRYEKLGSNVIFIFLSTEKEKVLTLLNAYAMKENVTLFGLKEWTDFKEVNSEIKNKYKFYYASPSFFSFKDPQIIPFHKQFRSKYNMDLNKIACLGYDATLTITAQFLMGKKQCQGLISTYDFIQLGPGNGFQNRNAFILKFEEFESNKVEWKRK